MELSILKRNTDKELFSSEKLKLSLTKAFKSVKVDFNKSTLNSIIKEIKITDNMHSSEIRDQIEIILMEHGYYNVAKAFIRHGQAKIVEERDTAEKIKFINDYCSAINSATGSKYDSNANVDNKNIATLAGELPKANFIKINRKLLYNKIKKIYNKKTADLYIKRLKEHFIYKNDETNIANYTYSANEAVFVKYKNNIYNIGLHSLYELCEEKEFCVNEKDDVHCKRPINMYVNDKGEFTPITLLTKKKRHRDLYRIKIASGEDLIVTDNHPLIISDDKNNTIEAVNSNNQFQYKSEINNGINNIDINYFNDTISSIINNYTTTDYSENLKKYLEKNNPSNKPIYVVKLKYREMVTCMINYFPFLNYKLLNIDMDNNPSSEFPWIVAFTTKYDNPNENNSSGWKNIVSVTKIENEFILNENEYIYDITTKSNTFICNNIWVHNCASITMYPWLLEGAKSIGGNSIAPTNLKSFCGGFINLVFIVSSMLSGACATPEFLMYLNYFIEKEYGLDYYKRSNEIVDLSLKKRTIDKMITDYFEQIIYSINQPTGARNFQAVFWNISYYDKYYFDSLFGNFVFPDGSKPNWESLSWLQKRFMKWFNKERTKTLLTFPVETVAMLTENGDVKDKEYADFTAKMYSEGHSFFTYLSDNADSLSSCCFAYNQDIAFKINASNDIINTTFGKAYDLYKNETVLVNHLNEWRKAKLVRLPARQMYKVTFTNDLYIVVSDNHLNATTCGIKATTSLKINDSLITFNNEYGSIQIKSIEPVTYTEPYIYCFEMEDQSRPYFTLPNGIITHNCRLRNQITDNEFSYTLGAGGVSTGSKSVLTINLNRTIQYAINNNLNYMEFLESIVDLCHKAQIAYNENLKDLQAKGMLPLFDAGYINIKRQYLTIGINGLVEAAEFLNIEITDNEKYTAFVQSILGLIESYNKKYKTDSIMFNTELIPAENVGIKHVIWDKKDGYKVNRNCYNSYFFKVEDPTLNVIDKFKLHGKKYIEHLTGGSALHVNLEEHLTKQQYRFLLKVAAQEGCNYFTFNIPNTICNDCGYIDKRYLKECPKCHSKNIDFITRIIGYIKRISNFSQGRKIEAKDRYYNPKNI